MKQKTCKVAKTVLTLLLCAGLTAGSVPIDALAADVQSEQPVGGTETDTEAGTEGNTQSTGSVSDGNVVIRREKKQERRVVPHRRIPYQKETESH